MEHFHEITVTKLKELLEELYDTDVLVPNDVKNLLIVREGISVGFIDLLSEFQEVVMWEYDRKEE